MENTANVFTFFAFGNTSKIVSLRRQFIFLFLLGMLMWLMIWHVMLPFLSTTNEMIFITLSCHVISVHHSVKLLLTCLYGVYLVIGAMYIHSSCNWTTFSIDRPFVLRFYFRCIDFTFIICYCLLVHNKKEK